MCFQTSNLCIQRITGEVDRAGGGEKGLVDWQETLLQHGASWSGNAEISPSCLAEPVDQVDLPAGKVAIVDREQVLVVEPGLQGRPLHTDLQPVPASLLDRSGDSRGEQGGAVINLTLDRMLSIVRGAQVQGQAILEFTGPQDEIDSSLKIERLAGARRLHEFQLDRVVCPVGVAKTKTHIGSHCPLLQFAIMQLPIATGRGARELFHFLPQFPDTCLPVAVVSAILGSSEQLGSLARGMKYRQ